MIQGTIIDVSEITSGTTRAGKPYQRIEFTITTAGKFEKTVRFTSYQEAVIKILGQSAAGTKVKVNYDPESKEFKGKWYTTLNAYALEING